MTQRQVSVQRDPMLPQIIQEVRQSHGEILTLQQALNGVHSTTQLINIELASLQHDFEQFVSLDSAHKELQISETRLVRVRQELETEFGHHDDIRRRATGLLQASSLSIVREETLRSASEESMISAPRYWLGPALVAISNWIGDRREIAERALEEALNRNDGKTSMLMALVCRRLGRFEQARAWLARYFSIQDPFALDRNVVVLLDALASGVFGAASKNESQSAIEGWLAEIQNRIGVVEAERRRWLNHFVEMTPVVGNSEFPELAACADNWLAISKAVGAARRSAKIETYVDKMFEGEIVASPRLIERVDDLVDALVDGYDDDELPLRREQHRLQLIVDENGNRKKADERFEYEREAFDAKVSFVGLLTNAAMGVGFGDVSRATQRLSFALSAPWIREAFEDTVADALAAQPATVEFTIDDWHGTTPDGKNEEDLVTDLCRTLTDKETAEIAALGGLKFWWPALAAFAALILLKLIGGFALLVVLGLLLLQGDHWLRRKKQIKRIQEFYARERETKSAKVRAVCAETFDFRSTVAKQDAVSQRVSAKLATIRADEQYGSTLEAGRRILV